MDQNQFDILRLIRSENLGVKTFYSLLEHYGTASEALKELVKLKNHKVKITPLKDVDEEIQATEKFGGQFIFHDDDSYPALLQEIDFSPPFLVAKGNIELLNKNIIAIVGSRSCSYNGEKFTKKIAKDLVSKDFIIASGLARGIDTAAHSESPANTIAVLAGGIDFIYPPENARLYEQIAEKGCIVAENKISSRPASYHFPQRNRIISGISHATIVSEATLKSGSLITAKYAAHFNRDVFAVPGFPMDQNYSGNNYLIKNGAYLLESSTDILEHLNLNQIRPKKTKLTKLKLTPIAQNAKPETGKEGKSDTYSAQTLEEKIIDKTTNTPIDIDELSRDLKIAAHVIQIEILKLELAGKIIRVGNNSIAKSSFKEDELLFY